MTKVEDKIEKLTTSIQRKLEGNPSILVGSGGSIPYGLPSMWALAKEITSKLESLYKDQDDWKAFVAELTSTNNLETALEKISLKAEIQKSIIETVWSVIDKKDRDAINGFIKQGNSPALSLVIRKFVQRAGTTNIVTTNYDRLVEYAIDCAEGVIENGFSGNCIKTFGAFSQKAKRVVNLYKVHGSIDWFRHMDNQNIIATNFSSLELLSDVYMPMIVTPGNGKYKETHIDPFRTVIAEADKSLRQASAYLCIGYGFNDEHIQPIIISENKSRKKPVVIVTKDVTEKMRELFLQDDSCNCLIVSENTGGGTLVHYSKTEIETFDENFWMLDSFYKLWFE